MLNSLVNNNLAMFTCASRACLLESCRIYTSARQHWTSCFMVVVLHPALNFTFINVTCIICLSSVVCGLFFSFLLFLQVIVVLFDDWTVHCYDSNLQLLWSNVYMDLSNHNKQYVMESAGVLISSHSLSQGNNGTIIVGANFVHVHQKSRLGHYSTRNCSMFDQLLLCSRCSLLIKRSFKPCFCFQQTQW